MGSEQPAAPKSKKLLIQEVDSSEQPAAPKSKKLLIQEVDSSEQPAAPKSKLEVDSSINVLDKQALKQAAKAHAQPHFTVQECDSKWKKEMDNFSADMDNMDDLVPDLPISDL